MKDSKQKVPAQRKGASSDIKHKVDCTSNEEAASLYARARNNLLDINNWNKLAGKLSAKFTLTDRFGKEINRHPLESDFIRIHLPSSKADKYDWVRIEQIEEENPDEYTRRIKITVRPVDPPKEQQETEHFFSEEATSNFFIERKGKSVSAMVRGRNELPNLDAPGILPKIRNVVVAAAAMAGLNFPQWKALAKGLLEK